MPNNHVHEIFQPMLDNFFQTSAFNYPSYFKSPDGTEFKAFTNAEHQVHVTIKEYAASVCVYPHFEKQRNEMSTWEHISEEYFLQKFEDAQSRIESFVPVNV